ncbi:metal transporter nramp1 [Quercus suber]|uniref:Metal transporter nramp1 n=1 Tax=Quercus suber TaxID=58331 RepID=A0AAW0LNK3_QUESU
MEYVIFIHLVSVTRIWPWWLKVLKIDWFGLMKHPDTAIEFKLLKTGALCTEYVVVKPSKTFDSAIILILSNCRHNLLLHSALVISRKIPHTLDGIKSASKCFLIESGLALFLAFLINVAVVSVSGSVCSNPNISPENKAQCKNITLESAASLLKNALGNWSSKLYAISLLASGQSSTVTGTYAGQYIMQGFLDLKIEPWLRNLITRFIAITPSLVVCIIGGSRGATSLIIIASVSRVSWLLGCCSIGINLYFLSTTIIGRITSKQTSKAESILTGVLAFPAMMLYVSLLTYLTLKREKSTEVP